MGVVMSDREEALKNIEENYDADLYGLIFDLERSGLTDGDYVKLAIEMRGSLESFLKHAREIANHTQALTQPANPSQ